MGLVVRLARQRCAAIQAVAPAPTCPRSGKTIPRPAGSAGGSRTGAMSAGHHWCRSTSGPTTPRSASRSWSRPCWDWTQPHWVIRWRCAPGSAPSNFPVDIGWLVHHPADHGRQRDALPVLEGRPRVAVRGGNRLTDSAVRLLCDAPATGSAGSDGACAQEMNHLAAFLPALHARFAAPDRRHLPGVKSAPSSGARSCQFPANVPDEGYVPERRLRASAKGRTMATITVGRKARGAKGNPRHEEGGDVRRRSNDGRRHRDGHDHPPTRVRCPPPSTRRAPGPGSGSSISSVSTPSPSPVCPCWEI